MNKNDNIFIGTPTTTPEILIKSSGLETDTIIFSLKGEEIIKVNSTGFYWKGVLIESDKEIYERFKEFLELSKPPKPVVNVDDYTMTSIISLAKQALLFYANSWNYQDKISNPSPMAFDDYGSQARFALNQIAQLENMQNIMALGYLNETIKLAESENTEDMEKILNEFKKI